MAFCGLMESYMPVTRRFLIAPSLTRLVRKECGSERVTEGFFAPQSERQSHIRIEKAQSFLVLTSPEADVEAAGNRTDLPRLHAEALLEACPGTVTFERSVVRQPGRDVLVDRFLTPGPLDLVSVEFTSPAQAAAFVPPVWFGDEVTHDDSYGTRALALSGLPHAPETPLSDAALEAVLDAVEGQGANGWADRGGRKLEGGSDESTFDMLRRLAVVASADPSDASEAEAAPAEETGGEAADARPRRPLLQTAPDRDENGDERLAGVIEGLSEALSQSASDDESRTNADLKARPAWRWSAH
jgi:CYTH domain-containing protein